MTTNLSPTPRLRWALQSLSELDQTTLTPDERAAVEATTADLAAFLDRQAARDAVLSGIVAPPQPVNTARQDRFRAQWADRQTEKTADEKTAERMAAAQRQGEQLRERLIQQQRGQDRGRSDAVVDLDTEDDR